MKGSDWKKEMKTWSDEEIVQSIEGIDNLHTLIKDEFVGLRVIGDFCREELLRRHDDEEDVGGRL